MLSEVSGYFTGPLFVGGSARNPIAYELRKNGREAGETLIVELTSEGMIAAFLGPFRPTVSEGHTTRLNLGWRPVSLDRASSFGIAQDLELTAEAVIARGRYWLHVTARSANALC